MNGTVTYRTIQFSKTQLRPPFCQRRQRDLCRTFRLTRHRARNLNCCEQNSGLLRRVNRFFQIFCILFLFSQAVDNQRLTTNLPQLSCPPAPSGFPFRPLFPREVQHFRSRRPAHSQERIKASLNTPKPHIHNDMEGQTAHISQPQALHLDGHFRHHSGHHGR